jgi:sulfite reductase alpha subunit-like flavoprotein
VAEGDDIEWAQSAYAARCTGLAEHYAGQLRSSERAMAAYSARLAGLAENVAVEKADLERTQSAYAARCTGLAEHYAGQLHSSERAMAAYSARLAGLAEYDVAARNDGLRFGRDSWATVIAAKKDPKRRGIPDAMMIEEDGLRKFVDAVKGSGEYT